MSENASIQKPSAHKHKKVTPNMVGKDGRVRVRMMKGDSEVYRRVAPVDANEYVKYNSGVIDPDPADMSNHPRLQESVVEKAVEPGNGQKIPDFNKLTVPQLRLVAEKADLPLEPGAVKADIVEALGNAVGTWDEFVAILTAAEIEVPS